MSEKPFIQNLYDSFLAIMKDHETERELRDTGDALQFPLLIVYVGRGSSKMHPEVYRRFLNLWPQSRNDFRFISAVKEGAETVYTEILKDGAEERPLTVSGVQGLVDEIQGSRTGFADFSSVYIYYFIETTDFTDGGEISDCFAVTEPFRETLNLKNAFEFYGILLDERNAKKEISRKIRTLIFESELRDKEHGKNILLVSNLLKNNARLADWSLGYDALRDLVALSDRATEYENPCALPGVKTVGITREEKPAADIARAVVLGMIQYLRDIEKERRFKLSPGKIGINENGTLQIFDEYTKKKVPKAEDLDIFPRPQADFYEMETLSYREFNAQTLGAWDATVDLIVKTVRDEVTSSRDFSDEWRNAYRALLKKNLCTDEMAELSHYKTEINEYLSRAKEPSEEGLTLDVALDKVGYLIASDTKVRSMVLSEIETVTEKAREFRKLWDEIYESRYELGTEKEPGVFEYYRAKVRHLSEIKGIEDTFLRIDSGEALMEFFENCFRDFIDEEPIFKASFDEELATRMEEAGDSKDSRDFIREKLVHSNTTQFLTTTLPLSMPIVSNVFVKRGSGIYYNLKKNLPEEYNYTYYDTGRAGYAEAIYIYAVPADYLLN